MPNPTRFGDVPFIADTTVWCKLRVAPPEIREDFRAAAESGLVVGTTVVWLEMVHHAPDRSEYDERVAQFSAMPNLPITEAISHVSMDAVQALREVGTEGYHRVKAADALIAAVAAANEVNVLHDDKHFGKLATVLDFEEIRFGPYH